MGLIDHFNTFIDYPGATAVHWIICMVSGFLIMHKSITAKIVAITLSLWWIWYETIEFLRIHDNGDIDIANGLAAYVVGIVLYIVYGWLHKFYLRRTN